MKNLFKNKAALFTAAVAVMSSNAVMAASTAVTASDDFIKFHTMINAWATGGLAVGLSLASLIIGAGIGVAKASPMPALGGVGLAAFFAFGPGVINTLILGGSVLY